MYTQKRFQCIRFIPTRPLNLILCVTVSWAQQMQVSPQQQMMVAPRPAMMAAPPQPQFRTEYQTVERYVQIAPECQHFNECFRENAIMPCAMLGMHGGAWQRIGSLIDRSICHWCSLVSYASSSPLIHTLAHARRVPKMYTENQTVTRTRQMSRQVPKIGNVMSHAYTHARRHTHTYARRYIHANMYTCTCTHTNVYSPSSSPPPPTPPLSIPSSKSCASSHQIFDCCSNSPQRNNVLLASGTLLFLFVY